MSRASYARAGPNCLQVLKSVLAGTLQESVLKYRRAFIGARDPPRGCVHHSDRGLAEFERELIMVRTTFPGRGRAMGGARR
jgi:hypothetical protein